MGAGVALLPSLACTTSKKPNFLFLYADDLSHEALSVLGSQAQTPNLDRLARRGVIFTNTYNQGGWHGAICVASRTMLLTGRFLWNAQKLESRLDEELQAGRLWPQYLAQAGYDTYMTGKWHVNTDAKKAFKTTIHVRPGGMPKTVDASYNRPVEGKPDLWSPSDSSLGGFWEGGEHWSEVMADDAMDFLNQAKTRANPFFMYLAFNAPHDPRQSPESYLEKYPSEKIDVPDNFLDRYPFHVEIGCGETLRDEKLAPFPRTENAVKVHRREYYAIISHLDVQIGRILDALEKSGKMKSTYIFFTGDNGLAIGHHGLFGKQNMFEHSMKVPLIVTGPGIPPEKRIEAPVYLQDIMPTTLELAGIPIPEYIQFRSLKPLIAGKSEKNYESIYGGYMNLQRMVRKDDFKLIYYPKINQTALFDLSKDPLEMNDLSGQVEYVTKLNELKQELLKLQAVVGDTFVITW
ncbi:sulfatase-like hydrolase/transferase [candidate division KSB1 bacterium]|nr:sulfatase-like hydrolase/transferase [candidate division KSB1 bacterium]